MKKWQTSSCMDKCGMFPQADKKPRSVSECYIHSRAKEVSMEQKKAWTPTEDNSNE